MGRIANFIDGAYLQYVLKEEFGLPKIDLGLLATRMAGGREILRTYFYDCLPYQSSPPTPDEIDRFGKRQGFHSALAKNPRFQIRLGRLEYRGRKSDGSPIFEQKRVDILMGVDLAAPGRKKPDLRCSDSSWGQRFLTRNRSGQTRRRGHSSLPWSEPSPRPSASVR